MGAPRRPQLRRGVHRDRAAGVDPCADLRQLGGPEGSRPALSARANLRELGMCDRGRRRAPGDGGSGRVVRRRPAEVRQPPVSRSLSRPQEGCMADLGHQPVQHRMRLAQGRWIGATATTMHCCRLVETLLALAQERHVEVAYGLLRFKYPDDRPDEVVGDAPPPRLAGWALQASLFHAGLRFVPLLYTDWLFAVPNDWSWGERLLRIGVRFAMLETPVVDYYPSRIGRFGRRKVDACGARARQASSGPRGARQPHLHRGWPTCPVRHQARLLPSRRPERR